MNLGKAYAFLVGQCTTGLQHRIEAKAKYEAKIKGNPIRLLEVIKENSLSFDDKKKANIVIINAKPSKLKTSFSGESKYQTPSESQTALNNYKRGPQRKAFFSQQEEISDGDEYANAEEQFSTDPEPEEHSPYSVY